MFGDHFYNQRVRKAVAIFGSLFDNLHVVRTAGSSSYSQIKVPLSYSPKRKFLERISEMNNGEDAERQLALKLPRMSFEILGINYDPNRQLPKTNSYKRSVPSDKSKQKRYYIGVPYVISFQLNVYAKTQDDALQCVEQIIPYFNPQYTVAMKPYDDVDDIVEDVPIILTAVSFSDDYEGAMEQRRTIVYTLDFEMKIGFYGPAPKDGSSIISQVDVNLYDMDAGIADSDLFINTMSITASPLVSGDSDFSLVITHLDSAQP